MMTYVPRPGFLTGYIVMALCLIIPSPVRAGDTAYQVLTDMAGRRVTLKHPVKTLVTTFKPASLCVFSLGLAGQLVGVDTSFKRDRLARRIYPGIAHLPGVGTKTKGINIETLAGLKPDLVILYSQKDGLALAERLADMDIPSLVIIPESFKTIKDAMHLIAAAAGVSHRMASIGTEMDQLLSLVTRRLAGMPETERKTAYFASSRGLFSTTTANMLQHDILTRAGVTNVSSGLTGYFQNVSPEQLVRWNPDMMILSQHMPESETGRLAHPALRSLNAVAAGTVFRCPSNLAPWDFPSPLSVLAVLWTARKAYPDRFNDIDMQVAADRFHRTLFNKTMTGMGGSINDTIEW